MFKILTLVLLISGTFFLGSCSPEGSEKTNDDRDDTLSSSSAPPLPDNLWGSFLISQFAERNGDAKQAYKYAKSALTLGGYDAKMIRYARYSAFLAGDVSGALAQNERLIYGDRDAPFYILSFFQAYQQGQWDKAASFLSPLASDEAYNELEPFLRGWLMIAQRADSAKNNEQEQKRILAAFSEALSSEKGVLSDLQQGYALTVMGKPDQGLSRIQSSLANIKGIPLGVLVTTAALMQNQNKAVDKGMMLRSGLDPDVTNTIIDMATKKSLPLLLDPKKGLFYLLQDLSYLMNRPGSQEDALMYASLSHQLVPENAFTTLHLAQILRDLGSYQQAEILYTQIPKTHPLFWLAEVYRAHLMIRNHRDDEALALIQPLQEKYPHIISIKKLYADLLKSNRQFKEALPFYDALIQDSEAVPDGQLYYDRAVCYERLGQWSAAEKDFKRAIDLNPQDPHLLNYLAYSWIDRGIHIDQAMTMLKKAQTLSPQSPDIMDSLAWGYYKQGKISEALSYLERAVMLSPADPVILTHYGDVFWAAGKNRLARYNWQHALEILRITAGDKTVSSDIKEQDILYRLDKNKPPAIPIVKETSNEKGQ